MYSDVEFTKLLRMARDHMEDNGFTPTTVTCYMRTWRSIYNFGISKGISCYSAELAEQYLLERYGVSIGETQINGDKLSPYMQQKIRAITALTDYKLHGFIPKVKRGVAIEWPVEYSEICRLYLDDLKSFGYSDQTWRRHEIDLFRFASFLHTRGVIPEKIEACHIYDYFITLTHLSKSSLATIKVTLTRFLKFIYGREIIQTDLSECLPRIRYYAKSKIDKVWTEEEVTNMLKSIDRSNPLGKRDFAIMVIAANLGLRTSDIIAISIDDFDWNKNCIHIVQEKTGEPLLLPISEQIGKAVIDYWMNGRPKTTARELFVQHVLPFQKLTNSIVYHIFNKYLESSGIQMSNNQVHGLHSLRHSLASRLLEKEVPVNVISNILGHVDSNTVKTYLQIDIEKLRQCSLEVPDYE